MLLAAGLKRNTPIPIYPSTEFVSDDNNITEVAQLWEELSGDPGVVALPQEFVSKKGLPEAMRFPWDTNKGVYLLEGFHSLHCLVSAYIPAPNEGEKQTLTTTITANPFPICLGRRTWTAAAYRLYPYSALP